MRRGLTAWSEGRDEESLSLMQPEIEWHVAFRTPDLAPGVSVLHGHDEIRAFWRTWRAAWERITIDVEDVVYDADDIVIARVRFRARGAGSGVELDRALFYVFELREGKAERIRPFDDQASARRAASLEP